MTGGWKSLESFCAVPKYVFCSIVLDLEDWQVGTGELRVFLVRRQLQPIFEGLCKRADLEVSINFSTAITYLLITLSYN